MTKFFMAVAMTAAGLTAAASAQTPDCPNCQAGAPAMAAPSSGGYSHGHGGYGFAGEVRSGAGFVRDHAQSHWGNSNPGAHPWTANPIFGHPHFNRSGNLSRQPTLPVYMAAPWYLYWPYDGHFQTVAPMAAGAQWMPPPQSAYGANATLPTYPGYVPYVPNQTYPNFGAPAQPNTLPPTFNPAPPANLIPINPAPIKVAPPVVVPPAKIAPAPPAKLIPGGELPKIIPN